MDNKELAYYKEQCSRLRTENMALKSELNQTKVAKAEAEENLQRIKGSFFWKLAKPLRLLRVLIVKLGYYRSPKRIAARIKYKKAERAAYKFLGTESFPSAEQRAIEEATTYDKKITISILVPLYNTPEKFLRDMIESVINQTYKDWQLCLADGSDAEHAYVEKVVKSYGDERITYARLAKNEGISGNTNECLKLATGDYIGLFDHDDILHPSVLYEYRKVIDEQNADYIFCDEATFEGESINKMVTLHFKADYALDSLRANNYICHFSVFKRSLLDNTELFRTEFDGSQDHDMILRLTTLAEHVVHVPKILYYWRSHAGSVASDVSAKPYCIDAAKRAVSDQLAHYGIYNTVITSTRAHATLFRLQYDVDPEPKVSVIIPACDKKGAITKCVESLEQRNTYENLEIIIVDNDSLPSEIHEEIDELVKTNLRSRKLIHEGAHNVCKMINQGARAAEGELLLLLNPEVTQKTDDYIRELVMYAGRKDIGAVAPKLLFNNEDIQHSGVILGIGPDRVAGHIHYGYGNSHIGYMGRLCYAQNLSAVSGDSMMISKAHFLDNGGFDEKMSLALYAEDLCIKLRRQGLLNVFTPFAEGYLDKIPATHDGSIEKSEANLDRYNAECEAFKARYAVELAQGDPYYNKNFTLDKYDYTLACGDYTQV